MDDMSEWNYRFGRITGMAHVRDRFAQRASDRKNPEIIAFVQEVLKELSRELEEEQNARSNS